MYPRNNASPPTVAVGSIYLIADGTIQTSGASVRVKTAGGSWGAGAGSLAYDTTSGAIEYTPSQAETNGEWFMVAVYKASCTTASITVVTSAESTAGKVSLGAAQTTNITGSLSGSVGSIVGTIETLDDLNTAMEARTLAAASYATDANQTSMTSTLSDIGTHLTDIKGAGWTTSDTLEAIRDRGDAAWVTATSVTVSDKTGFSLAADQSGVTIGTVTTNTDMRGTDGANTTVPDAAGTAAALHATTDGKVDTLLTRIPAALFSGITSLAEWLGLMAGKQTGDATARTEMRGTGAGSGTYDETADSLEAIRDRGDVGWTTGAGGSAPTVEQIRAEMDSNSTQLAAIVTGVGNIPTNPMLATEDGSSFSAIPDMATATNQATIAGYIDTEITTIITHLTDIKGTGFAKDTHSMPQCLTATGFSTHDAAAVVTALGTGSTLTACLTATGFAVAGDAMTLTSGERNSVADAFLNRTSGVETGVTPKQALQRIGASAVGKVSGAGTGTEVLVGLDGVTTRATVTVDASGNRTAVAYN